MTVVVQPSGGGGAGTCVTGPVGGAVGVVVADTVPGQYVVVYVVVIVVKPVGQMSMYEVTMTVVTVASSELEVDGVVPAVRVEASEVIGKEVARVLGPGWLIVAVELL